MADDKKVHDLEYEKWLRWRRQIRELKYIALAVGNVAGWFLRVGGGILCAYLWCLIALGKWP